MGDSDRGESDTHTQERSPIACLLGIGSNLGDREGTLEAAAGEIAAAEGFDLKARSRWWSSKPVGGPGDQGEFLNGALLATTTLPARRVIETLQRIESRHGRERRTRWAARPLDLDLLLFGDRVIDETDLQAPHPRMSFRPFVLGPAAEVAPGMLHPQLRASMAELHARLSGGQDAVRVHGGDETGRRRLAELVAACDARFKPVDAASGEGVALAWGDSAGPVDTPKLQICLGAGQTPLPATPALWLGGRSTDEHAEVAAAIECVWPS